MRSTTAAVSVCGAVALVWVLSGNRLEDPAPCLGLALAAGASSAAVGAAAPGRGGPWLAQVVGAGAALAFTGIAGADLTGIAMHDRGGGYLATGFVVGALVGIGGLLGLTGVGGAFGRADAAAEPVRAGVLGLVAVASALWALGQLAR